MGKVVGIDLGTTCSLISIKEGNQVRVLVNSEGSRLTPSVVAFLDDGTRLVGRPAKAQAAINPSRTLSSVKRLIGRRLEETKEDGFNPAYKVCSDENGNAKIDIDGKMYDPTEISAMVLQDLKKSAEKVLGEVVKDCIITVPARFGDSQRQATKTAAEIAGLRVLRVLSEPTSAALAYGLDNVKNERIVVIDCGGGTHDVSCIDTGDNVFQVLSTCGDLFLGGDSFDAVLMNFVADEFQKSAGCDVRKDSMAASRVLEACEKAKCDLSSMAQTTINIPYVTAIDGAPKHLSQTVTRAKFEQMCAPLYERFRAPIMQALTDAKLNPSQVQQVVLVGGSVRMPRLVEICKEIFNREPHQGVNPDEAIAIGAAICGSILSGETKDIVLLDVTPLTLGLETQGGICTPLIPRNSTIPTSKSETFSTASDNQPAVEIHVLQGERRMASGNRTLGRFVMHGIPLQGRGKPQIEILFDIDANGILSVTAKDKQTGKENKIEIKGSSGLEKSDIDRMVKDAAAYEAEDKSRAELIEIRNKADSLAYATENFLRENLKAIPQPIQDSVKQSVEALREVLDKNGSKDQLVSGISGLEGVNAKMYETCFTAPKAAQQQAPQTGTPTGEVIETQFEIKE